MKYPHACHFFVLVLTVCVDQVAYTRNGTQSIVVLDINDQALHLPAHLLGGGDGFVVGKCRYIYPEGESTFATCLRSRLRAWRPASVFSHLELGRVRVRVR